MSRAKYILSNYEFDHCGVPQLHSGYNLSYFGDISTNQ